MDIRIRAEALAAQNVDKGFDRFIRYYKENAPIADTAWMETGCHGEFVWAVYAQGSHRCQLAGCALDQSKEPDTWEALAAFTNCVQTPGKRKSYQAIPSYQEWIRTKFRGVLEGIENLKRVAGFSVLPEAHKRNIMDYAAGFSKSTIQPTGLPISEATEKHREITRWAAISRFSPIQEGSDYCQEIPPSTKPQHQAGQ
jgi:hypothetical protein